MAITTLSTEPRVSKVPKVPKVPTETSLEEEFEKTKIIDYILERSVHNINILPLKDPNDLRYWFSEFKSEAKIQGAPLRLCTKTLSKFMPRPITHWIGRLPIAISTDWDSLEKAMIEKWASPPHKMKHLQQKEDEDVATYSVKWQFLISQLITKNDEEYITPFLQSLVSLPLRCTLASIEFLDFNQLVDKAIDIERRAGLFDYRLKKYVREKTQPTYRKYKNKPRY
ncbi:hypothetical protein BDF14DRAFT_1791892 [Spinellus fusiger]|nr:hypothetical protein BDF14DRAFT_1791892 [Spinellus fusiger]